MVSSTITTLAPRLKTDALPCKHMPYRATDTDKTTLRLDSIMLHTQTCCCSCELDCLPALHQMFMSLRNGSGPRGRHVQGGSGRCRR